jgi:hypothetical protein
MLIFIGLYAKQKYYDTKGNIEKANSEINKLTKEADIQNGDIIFQTSLSTQSKAIQLATNSPYSHCGIIYKDGEKFYVFEAVQPVKKTPLNPNFAVEQFMPSCLKFAYDFET